MSRRNIEESIITKNILILFEDEKSSKDYISLTLINNGYAKSNFKEKNKKCTNQDIFKKYIIENKINVQIFLQKIKHNNAIMFVDTAKKELDTNKYNSVYCVFDYDANKPNSGKKEPYERVIKNKSSYENKNIYIINSSVCFEFWILLHFENTDKIFVDSEEIIKYIEKKYKKSYRKNGINQLIYKELLPQQQNAIKYAKNIEKKFINERIHHPCTLIYKLLENIKNNFSFV